MQTKAVVIEVCDSYAVVSTERTAACDGCHKAEEGGCSVCSLMGSNRKMSAKARNEVGAQVGDTVMIESDTSRMLFYAMLIFLLPLVVAILAWAIVSALTDSVLFQALGGFGGFLICFFAVILYARLRKENDCDIRIVEIVSSKM